MLHLPYTSMVLSFVVVGAVASPRLSWTLLLVTLLAYFAALGVGAHFLDQLPGMGSHYVRHWPPWALWTVGLVGVTIGVGIGIVGSVLLAAPALLVFVLVQGICALGYPLAPLFGGLLHRDSVFAISWGSLPCLTSYYVQSGALSLESLLLAAGFALLAVAEIRVSRWSRELRLPGPGVAAAGAAVPVPDAAAFRRPDLLLLALSLGTTLVAVLLLVGRAVLTT
ncbi:MAG: hypothetical protein L3K14_04495 [Thermoplasmata archaeon]|nr:hypothetical protein [Thermoplasmata archaeon]